MALSQEQISEIKKQLFEQIENFPPAQKESAKQQIEEMSSEELEEFLIKNNLLKSGETPNDETSQSCIFCSIVSGKTESYKIADSENAIAVLEINPISKGHVIIIPKSHISSDAIGKQLAELIDIIKEKITQQFSPKKIELSSSEFFGHGIINLIPIYINENEKSPRKKATPEELKELQKILKISDKKIEKKIEEEKKELPKIEELDSKKIWLPRRIP
jgi:histidine triad (HIT) family protein